MMSFPRWQTTTMMTTSFSKLFRPQNEAEYIWRPWYRRPPIVLPLLAVVIGAALLLLNAAGLLPTTDSLPDGRESVAAEAILQQRIDSALTAGEELPLYIRYRNSVLSRVQYRVLSVNARRHSMQVEFRYPDAVEVMKRAADGAGSAEEYYQRFLQELEQGNAPEKTETLTLSYTADGKLEDSEAFLNVISGGMLLAAADEMKGTGG